jgi:hypothetical protein
MLSAYRGVSTVLSGSASLLENLSDANAAKLADQELHIQQIINRNKKAADAAKDPGAYFASRTDAVKTLLETVRQQFVQQYKYYSGNAYKDYLNEEEIRALALSDAEHTYETGVKIVDRMYPDNFTLATAKSIQEVKLHEREQAAKLHKELLDGGIPK